ncbi:alcohol dehydrogenase GroES domain protein [Rhizoctonia solani 123E]|uniref:Alcohol dehydrogenase GroES domain protein n=1 Tax=Rhizoctonia solani 123E TaxID=1423351 RepID=A0A074SSA0_9AGAM|nr:alcohol dehydrogenase GroES domain protein [Rhizoctonia solani 123E]
MHGLRLEEFNEHSDSPVPRPRPGVMVVKVMAAGFYHTETVTMSGNYEGITLPVVPGHESVGVVAAAVGECVTEFKVGDRVGTTTFCFSCGKCDDCQKGISNYCDSVQAAGFTVDGGTAEYMRCDPVWTVKLPHTMPFEKAAPLMCAGSTI